MGHRLLPVIVVAGAAFAAGALAYPRLFAPGPVPEIREPAAEPTAPPPAAPAAAPVQRPAPGGEVRKLRLPDGTEVEPLNGVREPAAMTWTAPEYAPIVGTEFGNGVEWWVHADGTRTTTLEVWRPELGRLDPVTLVYHPTTPAAVDPGGEPPAGAGRRD